MGRQDLGEVPRKREGDERQEGEREAHADEGRAPEAIEPLHHEELDERVQGVREPDLEPVHPEGVAHVQREDHPHHVRPRVANQHREVDREVPADQLDRKEGNDDLPHDGLRPAPRDGQGEEEQE